MTIKKAVSEVMSQLCDTYGQQGDSIPLREQEHARLPRKLSTQSTNARARPSEDSLAMQQLAELFGRLSSPSYALLWLPRLPYRRLLHLPKRRSEY